MTPEGLKKAKLLTWTFHLKLQRNRPSLCNYCVVKNLWKTYTSAWKVET